MDKESWLKRTSIEWCQKGIPTCFYPTLCHNWRALRTTDFQEGPCQWLLWIGRHGVLRRSWLAGMDLEGEENSSHPSLLHAWKWHGPFIRRRWIPCADSRWRRRGRRWWSDQLMEWRWWQLVLRWGGKGFPQRGWAFVWHNQSYAHMETSERGGLVCRVEGFIRRRGWGEEWQALKKKEDKIHYACYGAT